MDLIATINGVFSDPDIQLFLAGYATEKVMDCTGRGIMGYIKKKYSNQSPEVQLMEVLNSALHDTCIEFGMETDYDAIAETYAMSLIDIISDINETGLKSILISAIGAEDIDVDDDIFSYWISRFDYTLSNPSYQWLQNFIERQYRRSTEKTTYRKQFLASKKHHRYITRLHEHMHKNVPHDNFSLNDIYIQLFGYYKTFSESHPNSFGNNNIVQTEEWILNWIDDENQYNILLLAGKPASGKTTLMKKLALTLSKRDYFVTLIPLKNFAFEENIHKNVGEYCMDNIGENPFESNLPDKNIVLLFDGLDEIALRGIDSLRKASDFIEQIIKTYRGRKTKVIVSGRSLSVRAVSTLFIHNAREYIIHLMPLYSDPEYIDRYWPGVSGDEIIDLRPMWWEKYGLIRNFDYSDLQIKIMNSIQCENETYDEITGEPFLLYLLASSYENGVFELNKKVSVNRLYEYFVSKIYKNEWKEYSDTSAAIDENSFVEFMQEAALCSWHSGERIIPLKSVERRCNTDFFLPIIRRMTSDQNTSEGITNLLLLFYIDKRAANKNEQSFEFTHKSFSDYFVGIKVAKTILEIFPHVYLKEYYDRLMDILGQQYLDVYIDDFMRHEFEKINIIDPLLIESVCDQITQIFPKIIKKDMRYCTILEQNDRFYYDNKSIVLGKNIFRIMCVLAKVRGKNITIPFADNFHFKDWINSSIDWHGDTIDDPADYNINVMKLISRIDFKNEKGLFFGGIQLQNYEIVYCHFLDTSLVSANMRFSWIHNINFYKTNFSDADFTSSAMDSIDFTTDEIESFRGTNFTHCSMSNMQFENANFINANFAKTSIKTTTFKNCQFSKCIFNNVRINNSNFIDCSFECLMIDSAMEEVVFIGNCEGYSVLSTDIRSCIYRVEDKKKNIMNKTKDDTKNVVYSLVKFIVG